MVRISSSSPFSLSPSASTAGAAEVLGLAPVSAGAELLSAAASPFEATPSVELVSSAAVDVAAAGAAVEVATAGAAVEVAAAGAAVDAAAVVAAVEFNLLTTAVYWRRQYYKTLCFVIDCGVT